MLELRPSQPEEIAAQKVLWAQVFGDDERYIDDFYRHCAKCEDMLVLLEDGVLRSMLALLPVTVALPDGDSATSAYIYALATDPACRKQGFGRMLVQYVDFYLSERGIESVITVPAEPGLHKFFASVGFEECFATRKIELAPSELLAPREGDSIDPMTPQAYGTLRETLLKDTYHATYSHNLLAYQQQVGQATGGGLYQVRVGDCVGCAAVEYSEKGNAVIKELVLPEPHIPAAMAVLAQAIPADRYHLRTPAFWSGYRTSYLQPFGMIKWLSGLRRRTWSGESTAYFGLAFD